MQNIKEIQNILRKHDPICLIAQGAPDDEYDSFADKILLVQKKENVEELAKSIHEIFIAMFDEKLAGSLEKYRDIAYEILSDREDRNKLDDENSNCKQCGHPFDPHIVIAFDKEDLSKGGIMKCPEPHCPCHHTLDFNLKPDED
jgi:hypothetical protein